MKLKLFFASIITVLFAATSIGQIYQHNFGTTTITTHPYTVAPAVFNANLSSSSWTNTMSSPAPGWTSYGGSSGEAIALSNSSGTPTITLTFNVATGYQLAITSFDFWRMRSTTGATNWSMTINGINVGSGTVTTSGAAIGSTAVANAVSGLTGTVTVVLSLSGASGTGTFRLDDFTLYGAVTSAGIVSVQPGDWFTPATWNCNCVPTSAQNVTVSHNVTSATAITRNAGTTTTISSGSLLSLTNTYTNNGTTTVNGTFAIGSAGVVISAGSTFQVNNALRIEAGGFMANAPVYGTASTLVYNTGGIYGRGFEWSSLGAGTIGVTPGYPNNVTIGNNTTLNYINGAASGAVGNKAIFGNLTIGSGSALYMDYGSVSAGGTLTVNGNFSNSGTFSMGSAVGDDLRVNANFTSNGTFIGNNRAVYFTKAGTQDVSSSSGLTIPYVILTNAATNVRLLSSIVISAPLAGNAITFTGASIIDLNGTSLTIGTSGVANVISGTGTFSGTATSNLTLLGTGSIGTIGFTSGFQNLGTFTINRTSGATAAVLSSPLTVNSSLALTNGRLDVANNPLTIGASGTISSSASNYIIADIANGSSAAVRKVFTAAGNFTFPIGDRDASADGSQYSPVTVTTGAGTYSGSAYVGVAVNDFVHPNLDATTHYLTRYWNIATSGVSGSIAMSATAVYQDVDIVGVESNLLSNRWDGSAWSNQGGPVTTSTNELVIPGLVPNSINHITAGWRNAEINIMQSATNYLTGSTYNFGTVLAGSSTPITFTIQNLGQQSLTLSTAVFSGTPNYTYTTAYGSSVSGPNGTTTFTVTFAPAAAGTFTGSITIGNNDPTGSENPYVINFTGISVVPAPEINLRGATGGTNSIVSGSTTADALNNTLFAATNIGASATKDFMIQNLGTAVLTLSGSPVVSIAGANPGDFTVTTAPAATSIAASANTTFVITFTPTAAGVRTAVVSIANNDSDENPYTFLIQGNGTCAAIATTITPTSGPVNTEVTITASSGNLTSATVSFNGIAASVTQISATQIKAVVPAGATSGAVLTTNSQGCTASNYFTVINNTIASCQGSSGTPRNQLFISEVTDHGSGSHSYVEIFNATGATVNLAGYQVRIYNNGVATPTASIILPSYNLLTGSSYVVAFGGSDSTSNPGGVSPNFTSNASGINDNDNIRLYSPTSVWIDLWGATDGSVFTVAPKDYTYRRKNTGITAPSTTWNPNDWVSFSPVDYTNVGSYDFSLGTPPTVTQQPLYAPSCSATTFTVSATEGFAGGNPLDYQWYVVAPGSTTWTPVSNSGVYSGATTATLSISNVTGLSGYQYYAQIRENTGTCFTASNAVMIVGSGTVTWNGSAWVPSAPTITSTVVIAGNYNTAANGSFDACSVTVNGGSTLNIAANNYVNIQSNLTVNASGVLNIADDGSLVMIDNAGIVVNNGTTNVVKTTSNYNQYDYTYWSSPVLNATIGITFPTWRLDYAFQFTTANYADVIAPFDGFDDNGDAWQNVSAGTVMTPGKGYAIMAPTTGTFPTSSTVTFNGKLNNGIITLPLALSANAASSTDDFNLIGNPYASAIWANDFINANTNTSGTLYFWTHRTGISTTNPGPDFSNFITADYAMYNLSGGTSSGTGSPAPTGYIASGQGFFVEAQAATNVVFNNSMRSKTYNNSQFYRSSAAAPVETSRDRMWLNLTRDALFSQQLIGYFPEATNDVDFGYDGAINPTSNTVSFYSLIGTDKYRIQGRAQFNGSDEVPLGYSTGVSGNLSISIDSSEGIFAGQQIVFLEDRYLHVIHNLSQAPYTFSTTLGTFDDRFVLRYNDGSLGVLQPQIVEDSVVAFVKNENIFVRSDAGEIDRITVFDMLGRTIFERSGISARDFQVAEINSGRKTLIIRVLLVSGKTITKKLIF